MNNQRLSPLQLKFLENVCRNIERLGPDEAAKSRFYGLSDGEYIELYRLMDELGFMTEYRRYSFSDTVPDKDYIEVSWNIPTVLAWAKSQEPRYRMVGLVWNYDVIKDQITGAEVHQSWRAKTLWGFYEVWRFKDCTEKPWTAWQWAFESYSKHNAVESTKGHCLRLDQGKQLCEAHWLKTLIDGGVIEESQ
jgi:hypothetical protein